MTLTETAEQLDKNRRTHDRLKNEAIDMIVEMRMAAIKLQRLIDKPICGTYTTKGRRYND